MATSTFGIRSGARVEVIIDGSHLYGLTRGLSFDVDFAKLRTILINEYDCRRINYITRVLYDERKEIHHAPVATMLDYIRFNGYNIILSEGRYFVDGAGRRIMGKNVDVQMTLCMMQAARHVDELIIVSGSEDLVPAVEECSRAGARVTLLSSLKTTPISVAADLRAKADWFVDLMDLKDQVLRRDLPPREPREREFNDHAVVQNEGAIIVEDRRENSFGNRVRYNNRSGQLA
jgi:uncharacterized LabA/DUF88 family protein